MDNDKRRARYWANIEAERARGRRYYQEHRAAKLLYHQEHKRAAKALKPPKPCVRCGGPTPSAKHTYCPMCKAIAARGHNHGIKRYRPGRTTADGYGWTHQKLRRAWAKKVATGTIVCARCGRPVDPREAWDLDHDPTDPERKRYLGPSHTRCNRATATHAVQRRKRQRFISQATEQDLRTF